MTPRLRWPLWGLMIAHAVSLLGNQVAGLALPWLVLLSTGSASRTGLVAFAATAPVLLSAIMSGWLGDRLGPRRLSIFSDALSGISLGCIPLLLMIGHLEFWLLLVLTAAGSLFDLPGYSARQALIPTLARPADMRLERANAIWETVESGAVIIGPPLAGVLIAILGPEPVLWVTTGGFAFAIVATLTMIPSRCDASVADGGRARRSSLSQLAGFQELFARPILRGIAIRTMVLALIFVPLFTVIMPFSFVQAGHGPGVYGGFVAMVGAGSLVSAVVYGAIGHRLSRRWVMLVGTAGIAVALVLLAPMPALPVLFAAALIGGVTSGPLTPLMTTIVQEQTREELRVRVLSALNALGLVAGPVSVLAAGFMLDRGGLTWVLGAAAVLAWGVTMWSAASPTLRRLEATSPPGESIPALHHLEPDV